MNSSYLMTTPINELDNGQNTKPRTYKYNYAVSDITINTPVENREQTDADETWNSHPERQTSDLLMGGE